MTRAMRVSISTAAVVLYASMAPGAELFFRPISASGSHTLNGNEIILDGGGQTVTLELRVDTWAPVPDVGVCPDGTQCSISAQDCSSGTCESSNGMLATYQATIDSSGYGGVLLPATTSCVVDADCLIFGAPFATCDTNINQCEGDAAAYVDSNHAEYVFATATVSIPAVTFGDTLDWAMGAVVVIGDTPLYPGVDKYGGTLVLDVPVGVAGSFTIGFIDSTLDTFMRDSNNTAIMPMVMTPAIITIPCTANGQCDDANACTTDSCNIGTGVCVNTDTTPPGMCCAPASGTLTPIDDGNDCTVGTCNPDGSVTQDPLPSGAVCGTVGGECDAEDTCDGAGTCTPTWAPQGTACGSPATTDCTDPDTCNGFGACDPNHQSAGTSCGDTSTTDCTNPDTCNGGGACQPNHLPNGTGCDDGAFCTVGETCTNGSCGGGGSTCDDGVPCTDDSCNEALDQCTNSPNDALCNNGQFCDGVEVCDAVAGCVVEPGTVPDCNDGVNCTVDSCNEAMDQCVFTPNDGFCDNGLFCDGAEVCDGVAGCLAGADPNCDDGILCTDDSCSNAQGQCVNAPNDTLCPDDGLFCNGDEFCSAINDCDHTGSPCGGPCDEVNDTCLCDAPIVVAVGPRYLRVSLQPPGSTAQQAIVVQCPTGATESVGLLFSFNNDGDAPLENAGILGGDALFLTPAEWGDSVYVTGDLIPPDTDFIIWADCGSPGSPALSDPAMATTWVWGDVDGDGSATFGDILDTVRVFQGQFAPRTTANTDMMGNSGVTRCLPNQETNFGDILAAVTAFQNQPYVIQCTNVCD